MIELYSLSSFTTNFRRSAPPFSLILSFNCDSNENDCVITNLNVANKQHKKSSS